VTLMSVLIDSITEDHLRSLIDDQVVELRIIEYKRDPVTLPRIHPSAWKGSSRKFAQPRSRAPRRVGSGGGCSAPIPATNKCLRLTSAKKPRHLHAGHTRSGLGQSEGPEPRHRTPARLVRSAGRHREGECDASPRLLCATDPNSHANECC